MMKLFFTAIFGGMCLFVNAQQRTLSPKDSLAVKEYFFAGLKDKLSDNYARASVSFTKLLTLDPNNDATHFEIANLSFQQNKLLDAEVAIKKALTIKPNEIWYLKLQTDIYKRTGNMEALMQTLNELIKLDPEMEAYQYDRANAFFITGDSEKAMNAYNELEQKFGVSKASTAAKQRIGQKGKGAGEIDFVKLIDENPDDINHYLALSGKLLEQKKNEEALVVLLKAKNLAPNHHEVNLALADIYYASKRNDESFLALKLAFVSADMPLAAKIKILRQLLSKFNNPQVVKNTTELATITLANHKDDVQVLVLFGDILYRQGNLKGAAVQYVNAVTNDAQLYIAWEKLLAVQTLMGNYVDAIKTGEEALSNYPNQAILYYYRAFALHRNGQNAEAALELKSALQLDPEENSLKAMILALQAEVMIDQGKLKEADALFAKSVELAPDNYLTMSNYAYFLALRNHDLSKAEKLAEKAVNAMPKDASILDTYAMVLFKLGRFADALKNIEKAIQNNGGQNEVYIEHYGDILFLNGDKEKAVLQWQKSQKEGNQSEKLKRKINEKKYIK